MRRRSRERLLQATVELVEERGYEATTLADITQRAGTARGLVSYYFSGKRALLQSAVHRLMALELVEGLEREPRTDDGRELLARAIDAVLGTSTRHTTLMRTHMASILQEEGFIQCPEQQRLARLLRDTMIWWGAADPDEEYPLLRALLMGASVAMLLPGAPMPVHRLRAELFQRYDLDWDSGTPPPGAEDYDPTAGNRGVRVSRMPPAGTASDRQQGHEVVPSGHHQPEPGAEDGHDRAEDRAEVTAHQGSGNPRPGTAGALDAPAREADRGRPDATAGASPPAGRPGRSAGRWCG